MDAPIPATQAEQAETRFVAYPTLLDPSSASFNFVTENDNRFDGNKVLGFEVIGDGEMHTYELDFSSFDTWTGFISGLRFDPVTTAGTTIEIEGISVGN